MTPDKYRLTATRGEALVLRQGFDHLDDANRAVCEALARYLDCEIRLTEGYTVLLSAAPRRSGPCPGSAGYTPAIMTALASDAASAKVSGKTLI